MTSLSISSGSGLVGIMADQSSPGFVDQYPSDLQEVMQILTKDGEVWSLIEEISSENPLRKLKIAFSPDLHVNELARCSYGSGIIALNDSLKNRSVEEILPYVFFELQNAKQYREFNEIEEHGLELGIEEYVERIEKCEYQSALATHQYVQKLIGRGELTTNAPFALVFSNFRDHYLFQQVNGHSQQIAERFNMFRSDSASRFLGTWKTPPSLAQSDILKRLLQLKLVGQTGTSAERVAANSEINKIILRINDIVLRSNHAREAALLLENAQHILDSSMNLSQ